MQSIRSINLSGCLLSDISHFANLPFLEIVKLVGCKNISDVSPLAKIKSVDLSSCSKVEDVSKLGVENEYLNLSLCKNVKNVSKLGGVSQLILKDTGVLDVSALRNVGNLDLCIIIIIINIILILYT